jgi:hypothetical protein
MIWVIGCFFLDILDGEGNNMIVHFYLRSNVGW